MGQEFIIKSQDLEDKINQLLPSQGGFQAGVDLSASTQIIPIIDLTETAEGSLLRQDLQTCSSLNSITSFSVSNTTSTLVNTTGYYKVFGAYGLKNGSSPDPVSRFSLTDGTTTKDIWELKIQQGTGEPVGFLYDFVVLLEAGHSLTATTNNSSAFLRGSTRQIADLQGNLVNP